MGAVDGRAGEAGADDEEYEGWDDEDDYGAQGDVEDTSWKVRKGGVRVVDAMIASCPESLKDYWTIYINLL